MYMSFDEYVFAFASETKAARGSAILGFRDRYMHAWSLVLGC